MSAWRRSVAAVLLLAVLCLTVGCAATQQRQQQQPSAVSSTATVKLSDLIARAVRAELQPLVSKLDELSSRLDRQQLQLDELAAKVEKQNHRPDETISKINSQESRIDELNVKVDSQKSQMDGIAAEADSQMSKLENLTTGLISQEFQVAGLVTKQDSLQSQLVALVSTSNSERCRQDGAADQTAGSIAGLTVRLDRVEEMANQTAGLIAGLTGRLDRGEEMANQTAGSIAGLTGRLDRGEEMANQTAGLIAGLTGRLDRVEEMANQTAGLIAGLTGRLDWVVGLAPRPRDCSDLSAGATTGVHVLWPDSGFSLIPIQGFCDMDTDGGHWTVFQRRQDIRPRQDFYLGWESYKEGFGNLTGEFWWGLQYLSMLTSVQDRQYELRIDLEDIYGNTRYALYQGFRISSEADGYRLRYSSYTGDAGDSLSWHNNYKFSTRDRDQDGRSGGSCAEDRQGAWWYNNCTTSHLNGPYLEDDDIDYTGIWWVSWKAYERLKSTDMKIRPT